MRRGRPWKPSLEDRVSLVAASIPGSSSPSAGRCPENRNDRDMDRPGTTATDPGFSAGVSLEMSPPLIHDADPRDDLLGWQAWAEPVLGAPYLWCASVPHELVAAFASSLAAPDPVPRRMLPEGAEHRLTVVHRG